MGGAHEGSPAPDLSPSPLLTTAANDFAHDTMVRRLPTNLRNVVDSGAAEAHGRRGPEATARVLELADAIAGNQRMPAPRADWPDREEWSLLHAPWAGQRWHETGWFFAETYAFRLLMDAVGWAMDGSTPERDPFAPVKRRELERSAAQMLGPLVRALGGDPAEAGTGTETGPAPSDMAHASADAPRASRDELLVALTASMWGNRADVSFTAGRETGAHDDAAARDDAIIVDDRAAIVEVLAGARTVAIVLDNAGAELASDLALAELLVRRGVAVALRAKAWPTYVSDATKWDVETVIALAADSQDAVLGAWAARLRAALDSGSLRVIPEAAWCAPWYLRDMPAPIATELADADAIIMKGDLNYRRVMRDTLWPDAVSPFAASGLGEDSWYATLSHPPAVIAMRTMKSDVIVGIDPARRTALDRTAPGWRTAGDHALAQLVTPGSR